MAVKMQTGYVFYKLPNAESVFFSGEITHEFPQKNEAGFLFHPFQISSESPLIFIKKKHQTLPFPPEIYLPKCPTINSTQENDFLNYVKESKSKIAAGELQKTVAARISCTPKSENFNPVEIYKLLCEKFPDLFVSLVYIPNQSLWLGASPEILATENETHLQTFSLAGTKNSTSLPWNQKEIEEQNIVTHFIKNKLQTHFPIENISTQNSDKMAGNLVHLLTTFSIFNSNKKTALDLAQILHPTPAVCGFPVIASQDFIIEKEAFHRKYYSGYLGPINIENTAQLFVNIRCAEITDSQTIFYAGCGITHDSNPADEWQETTAKINVLKTFFNIEYR